MNHPFDLTLADLEAIDIDFVDLTDEEAAKIGGASRGNKVTTLALGEEGGRYSPAKPIDRPPGKPPEYTTLAVGEEGGEFTTLAIGEEGG